MAMTADEFPADRDLVLQIIAQQLIERERLLKERDRLLEENRQAKAEFAWLKSESQKLLQWL